LLFLFPMWPAYPKVVAVLILLLLGAFAIPAFRQKAEPEPAPALS